MPDKEVRRDVIKLGLNLDPVPLDVGDGTDPWVFSSDPSPEQWGAVIAALKKFEVLAGEGAESVDGDYLTDSLNQLTQALMDLLTTEAQKKKWVDRAYGLGPQQAISEVLMEQWTGFPTKPGAPSGKASKKTG